MTMRLRKLKIGEVSLVTRPASPGATVLFHKSEDRMNPLQRMMTGLQTAFEAAIRKTSPSGEQLDEDGQLEVVNAGLAEVGKALGEPTETPAGDPPTEGEAVLKAAEELAQELVTKAEARANEAIAKAEAKATEAITKATEALSQATKLIQASEHREAITKADAFLGMLPGDKEKFAGVITKLNPEEQAVLKQTLEGANALVRDSLLFRQIGAINKASQTGGASVPEEFITKAMTDDKISRPAAIAKYYKLHPEAYDKELERAPSTGLLGAN